jgi:molecular chaperone HscB
VNYFELLGQPIGFEVDRGQLAARYRNLQQSQHPDNFVTADAQTQRLALSQSALLNDAFQTLSSPVQRANYLLSLQGIDALNEQDTRMPQAFLLAQLDRREAVSDAIAAEDTAAIEQQISELLVEQKHLESRLAQAFHAADLTQARDLTRQLQFLSKIEADAASALDHF